MALSVAASVTLPYDTNISNATTAFGSAISVNSGDLLVGLSAGSDGPSSTLLSNSDSAANSYTQRAADNTGSHCAVSIYTAPSGSTASITPNLLVGSNPCIAGSTILAFRGHNGIGNILSPAFNQGGASNLTTTGANSAICVVIADWSSVDTTSTHTFVTINGNQPTGISYGMVAGGGDYSWAVAYWLDCGAAGAKTVQLSSPTLGTPTITAIEILSGATNPVITAQPTTQTVYENQVATFTISATGTGTLHYQWKDDGSNVGSDSSTYAPTATLAMNGSLITCVVTDDGGSTTSDTVYLNVLPSSTIGWTRA